jgi:two-component system, NtrC family, response regulator GlrR
LNLQPPFSAVPWPGRSVTRPRCIVLSEQGEGELARGAYSCLASVEELELRSERFPRPGEALPSADVIIVPVAAITMQRTVDLLARVRLEAPRTSILVIGEALTQEQILRVLTAGAYDFVSAPYLKAELVTRTLRGVGLVQSKPPEDIRSLLSPRAGGLIGNSPAFLKQMARLPLLAGCDAGVLILGETGTGKELFAQAVHYLSARVSRPWVPVNCAAIPVELIESELFGHTRGAYTTAHSAREGLIAAAESGTLFLDEIGSLPLSAQGKLLRFLQEREYRPVGSNTLRRADVRVIAASNQDLAALVARDRFRQDLYFRLNVLTLTLSPLRERREDIPTLAQYFVKRFATEFGRPVQGLTPLALGRLIAHSWPGNVREFSHAIERAVLLANGPYITPADIEVGEELAPLDDSFQAAKARVVEQFERSYIEQILIACDGNITHAAQAAKKNRRALWELMRKHRIEAKRFRSSENGGAKSVASA